MAFRRRGRDGTVRGGFATRLDKGLALFSALRCGHVLGVLLGPLGADGAATKRKEGNHGQRCYDLHGVILCFHKPLAIERANRRDVLPAILSCSWPALKQVGNKRP